MKPEQLKLKQHRTLQNTYKMVTCCNLGTCTCTTLTRIGVMRGPLDRGKVKKFLRGSVLSGVRSRRRSGKWLWRNPIKNCLPVVTAVKQQLLENTHITILICEIQYTWMNTKMQLHDTCKLHVNPKCTGQVPSLFLIHSFSCSVFPMSLSETSVMRRIRWSYCVNVH